MQRGYHGRLEPLRAITPQYLPAAGGNVPVELCIVTTSRDNVLYRRLPRISWTDPGVHLQYNSRCPVLLKRSVEERAPFIMMRMDMWEYQTSGPMRIASSSHSLCLY